ncbi:hypothetical protein ACSFBM_33655 [Variovorax sp. GB1R11]|uniref:hypothetical protein n=1 Tax=Variovorax sp. GB1R11 TaxID=3443741 RepID=UPI003F45DA4F
MIKPDRPQRRCAPFGIALLYLCPASVSTAALLVAEAGVLDTHKPFVRNKAGGDFKVVAARQL